MPSFAAFLMNATLAGNWSGFLPFLCLNLLSAITSNRGRAIWIICIRLAYLLSSRNCQSLKDWLQWSLANQSKGQTWLLMYVVDNLATKEDLAISFKRNPAKQSYSFSNTTSRSFTITALLDCSSHSFLVIPLFELSELESLPCHPCNPFLIFVAVSQKCFEMAEKLLIKGLYK